MLVVAITGGIGSGKSTARRFLERMGAVGVSADVLARRVVQPGTEGARRVREAFGDDYFDDEGGLIRDRMASLVFLEREARKRLEEILHPIIRAEEERIIEGIRRHDPEAVVAVEIPLLSEGVDIGCYDAIILVTAPREKRLERLVQSGKYSLTDAENRMENQVSDEERSNIADFEVDNGGTIKEMEDRLRQIMRDLRVVPGLHDVL